MYMSDEDRDRLYAEGVAAEAEATETDTVGSELYMVHGALSRYTALVGRDRDWLIAYISGTESTREGIIIHMPCGVSVRYAPLTTLPEQDAPCPCGNPNHWLIQYEVPTKCGS